MRLTSPFSDSLHQCRARSFCCSQHHACSSFLHGSCRTGGSNVHTVIRQPQLPVECPLCKKTDAANHESKSLSPSCDESSLPKFSSVSDYYDHIIRCHLSLPALPRERFAKVAQPCCNNTVPVVRPFAVGIARRPVKHVSRRGPDEGVTKTQWRGLWGPKSVIENQKRAEAWELIWRSPDDGSGISKYRRWNAWLRENTGESTSGIAVTSARTHRAVERSSRRALVTVRSIKTPSRKLSLPDVVGGRGRSIVPTVRSSQSTGKGVQRGGARGQKKHQMGQPFMSVFAAFVNGLTTEALGSTGLEEVEMAWLHEFRKKLTSALDVGRFLEMWNIRETHPKGGPVRTLVRYRMSPRGCTEHHQTGTHSTQSSSAPQGHRAGRPSTADEQRAKNSESTRAAPQESGGQIRLEDEIDIYETDLAESLAMWGFWRGRRGLPMSLLSPSCLRLHPVEQFTHLFSIARELCWLAVRRFCGDTLLIAHDGGDLRNACTSSLVSVYTAVSLSRCRVDSRMVTIDGR